MILSVLVIPDQPNSVTGLVLPAILCVLEFLMLDALPLALVLDLPSRTEDLLLRAHNVSPTG